MSWEGYWVDLMAAKMVSMLADCLVAQLEGPWVETTAFLKAVMLVERLEYTLVVEWVLMKVVRLAAW